MRPTFGRLFGQRSWLLPTVIFILGFWAFGHEVAQCNQPEGRSQTSTQVALHRFISEPLLLSDTSQYESVINDLIASGKSEEALRWCKLALMQARFDAASLNRAIQLLSRAWSTVDESTHRRPRSSLAETELPLPPTGSIERRITDLIREPKTDSKVTGRQLVSLHLLNGNRHAALREALASAVQYPTDPEVLLEVARALKAIDFNLHRVNRWVEWMRDGEGKNPLLEDISNENSIVSAELKYGEAFEAIRHLSPLSSEQAKKFVVLGPESNLSLLALQFSLDVLSSQAAWTEGRISIEDTLWALEK